MNYLFEEATRVLNSDFTLLGRVDGKKMTFAEKKDIYLRIAWLTASRITEPYSNGCPEIGWRAVFMGCPE